MPHERERDVGGDDLARACAPGAAEREARVVLEAQAVAQPEAIGDAAVRPRLRLGHLLARARGSAGRAASR